MCFFTLSSGIVINLAFVLSIHPTEYHLKTPEGKSSGQDYSLEIPSYNDRIRFAVPYFSKEEKDKILLRIKQCTGVEVK